jgi:hypothetical protein
VAIDVVDHEAAVSGVLHLVGEAVGELGYFEELSGGANQSFMSPVKYEGIVGRPCYFIPQGMLENLVNTGFTVPQIADILCVSVRTVH